MSDGGGIDTASGMGLFVQGGQLVLIGSKGTAGQFNFVLSGPVIDDGQWHQFAATWTDDTTVNGVKLYMDGVLVAQGTALASIASDFEPPRIRRPHPACPAVPERAARRALGV